jgi:hypothetical protein
MFAPYRVLVGLAVLFALSLTSVPPVMAAEANLSLTTGFFDRWVVLPDAPRGVARFGLQVTLDAKGGEGILELDPNVASYNRFGDLVDPAGVTEIAPIRVKVTLRAEETDRKGRRLYRIEGKGLRSRLALVLARGGDRLLILDQSGNVRDVFPLK